MKSQLDIYLYKEKKRKKGNENNIPKYSHIYSF